MSDKDTGKLEKIEAKSEADASKSDKPKTRVFRQSKPYLMKNKTIITLMEPDIMVGTAIKKGKIERIAPNHASQYVLNAGAYEYDKQLEALRVFEKAGEIVEVDAKNLGIPFISEEEKALAEFEKKAREIRKSLGLPEK